MANPPKELVHEFIDAAVKDQVVAGELLSQHPELLNARFLHGETLLHFLAIESFRDAVQFLAERGADVNLANDFGDTPLIDACSLGHLEIAQTLLTHGASVDTVSPSRDTALFCAIRSGNARLVELLLDHGADAEYKSPFGQTIFDVLPAEPKARQEIYRVLEKHAAQPKA